jgi:PIN domain nuclease of toxin-antitoxin system
VRLLLDTHALLWWLNHDVKLGNHVRGLIGHTETDVLECCLPLGNCGSAGLMPV